MIDFILKTLKERGSVVERDVGENREIRKRGMKFVIRAYDLPGVGNLSTVRMSAMLGLMKMDTVVLTPLVKDAPLFSYDWITVTGTRTLLIELYDTCLKPCDVAGLQAVRDGAAVLPDNDLGKHWYDGMKLSPSLSKKGKGLDEEFRKLREAFFLEYLNVLDASPACSEEEKRAKTAEYVDGLFTHGGPAADQFQKLIGKTAARKLFARFIFASEK